MVIYLTSSFNNENGLEQLNDFKNNLTKNILKYIHAPLKVLYLASDPNNYSKFDKYATLTKEIFVKEGFIVESFLTLDNRNKGIIKKLIDESNFLILAGGHTPTQNDFFKNIKLKDKLKGFKGIILGISAGAMNMAKEVYVEPEFENEVRDTSFIKFRPGLDLINLNVLPHYNSEKDTILNGCNVFSDIAYKDSMGKEFFCINDGTFIVKTNEKISLYGEAYIIQDGKIRKYSSLGEIKVLDKKYM